MREILFRAKRKCDGSGEKKGDWVYGDLVRLQDGKETITAIYYHGDVMPNTVGQYTGLTDKNGTKIFEGDILEGQYTEDDGEVEMFRVTVGWSEREGCYMAVESDGAYDALDKLTAEDMAVVGNIHD